MMWEMCPGVGDSVDLHTAVRIPVSGDSHAPAGHESCHSLQACAFTIVSLAQLQYNSKTY